MQAAIFIPCVVWAIGSRIDCRAVEGILGVAMSKIQFKIMCSLALLVIVVVGSIGILAEQGLRERMTSNVQIDLERQARLVAQLVEKIGIEARISSDSGK